MVDRNLVVPYGHNRCPAGRYVRERRCVTLTQLIFITATGGITDGRHLSLHERLSHMRSREFGRWKPPGFPSGVRRMGFLAQNRSGNLHGDALIHPTDPDRIGQVESADQRLDSVASSSAVEAPSRDSTSSRTPDPGGRTKPRSPQDQGP